MRASCCVLLTEQYRGNRIVEDGMGGQNACKRSQNSTTHCIYIFFYVFSTVHQQYRIISSTNFYAQFNNTCMSHYYPRHVSGLDMPFLRRNNCTNTASGRDWDWAGRMHAREAKIAQHFIYYVEIKCQLDATDYIYCRFYCMLNMFRAILCVRFAGCCSSLQTGHITFSSTPYRQPENQSTKYNRQRPSV